MAATITTTRRRGMPATRIPDVEELTADECWRLLRLSRTGRLAVRTEEGVDIFPVTYMVHDRRILLRSGPGSKMLHLGRYPSIAFEVDGRGRGRAWSVVLHGEATRMSSDSEILDSGVRDIVTSAPGAKFNYVRIDPVDVTGRRFRTFTGTPALVAIAVLLGAMVVALGAVSILLGR